MDQQVDAFFQQYEKANASSNVEAIGHFYADTFMFGGTNDVQAVKKEDFLKVLPKMKGYFCSMGLSETQLQTVQASVMDSKYLLAKVGWRMTVRTSLGSKALDIFATYILARTPGNALSIVFQIDHQDLAAVIKDQHNIQ